MRGEKLAETYIKNNIDSKINAEEEVYVCVAIKKK